MRKGQSLVEMAIITPLLLFLLFGVIEVGVQIRRYLVLTNSTREMGRYLARTGTYLDLSDLDNPTGVEAAIHRWTTANKPLFAQGVTDEIYFQDRVTLVLTPIRVENQPCQSAPLLVGGELTYEPMLTPTIAISPELRLIWPATHPDISKIDALPIAQEFAQLNHEANCRAIAEDRAQRPINAMWVVETEYISEHLFGFPFISNPYTDPLPLYTSYYVRDFGQLRGSGLSTGYRATVTPTATNTPE